MKLNMNFNFMTKLKRIDQANKLFESKVNEAVRSIENAKEGSLTELRKYAMAVQKGTTCDVCGRNVYAATNFVHSEYKAYCIDPCWEEHKKGKL